MLQHSLARLRGTQPRDRDPDCAVAKGRNEATEQKQAARAATVELRQSLQQERDRTEAMARDLATVRRTMDGRVTVGRSADSHVVQ